MFRSRFNAVTDMNPSKLRDIFDKYGRLVRVVYASCIGTIERQFENGVKEAIQGMDLDHLRSFLSKSVEDTWIDSVSSKLFVVRPSASPPEHTSRSVRRRIRLHLEALDGEVRNNIQRFPNHHYPNS